MRSVRISEGIVATAFAAGIVISHSLWYASSRLYPRAPIIPGASIPDWLELPMLAGLLLSLAIVALRPFNFAIWTAVALTAAMVIFDQSRLQPWVYEYCLLLIALRYGSLRTCRAIVIALYFWSGLQKINSSFVTRTWPEFVHGWPALGGVAWLVPLVEVSIAIGLMTRRGRIPAAIAAVGMHAFNIVALSRSGENYVVLPWNAAMAALVVVLFAMHDKEPAERPSAALAAIAIAVWVLPVLSFFSLWDAYLSAALYAGNTVQGVVVIGPEVLARLPPVVRRNTWTQSSPMFIDINRWSYEELNVPAYPAERVLKSIGASICRAYVLGSPGRVVILGRAGWRSGARSKTSYECSQF